jgi:hypothetical protein
MPPSTNIKLQFPKIDQKRFMNITTRNIKEHETSYNHSLKVKIQFAYYEVPCLKDIIMFNASLSKVRCYLVLRLNYNSLRLTERSFVNITTRNIKCLTITLSK